MSSETPLPPAPKTAKRRSSKNRRPGPTVSERIIKAVSASKERSGVSLAALKKTLIAGGYDVSKNNARVKAAIRRLVAKGHLQQAKGRGASGSFKINKQAVSKKKTTVRKKKSAIRAKKPAAKKRKRASVKKPAGPKKAPKRTKRKRAAAKKTKSQRAAKKPRAKKVRTLKSKRKTT